MCKNNLKHAYCLLQNVDQANTWFKNPFEQLYVDAINESPVTVDLSDR